MDHVEGTSEICIIYVHKLQNKRIVQANTRTPTGYLQNGKSYTKIVTMQCNVNAMRKKEKEKQ